MSPIKFILWTIFIVSINNFPQSKSIKLSDDLEIVKLSENVYIHISYYDLESAKHFPANGLVYLEDSACFIIDTGWTNEEIGTLLDWLTDSLRVSIEGVIITHWHIDCMGGLAEVQKRGVPSYAHRLTCEIAKTKNLPVPEHAFQDSLALWLNKTRLVCHYFGAGHALDNIVVWIPKEKILFGGCLLKALEWKNLGFLGDANVAEWPKTLKKVLDTFPKSRMAIPGHGDPGDLSLVHHTLDLLKKKNQAPK